MNLAPFKQVIEQRCGLDFKPDSFLYLDEAVQARMRAQGLENDGEYLVRLKGDAQEISHLVNLLTNNETYFFRERGHYRLVTRRLFPELMKNRLQVGQPVRLVSAGCATGEEPYSLAIALAEHFGEGVLDHLEIIGLDIDEEALHEARMAVYGDYSFRGVDPAIRSAYFHEFPGNRYILMDTLRNRVRFLSHNLVTWPYPPEAQEADLIFYRNVSIYYQSSTQGLILKHLANLLSPKGYLIMGAVEIGQHHLADLHLNQEGEVFYFSKTPGGPIDPVKPPAGRLEGSTPVKQFPRRSGALSDGPPSTGKPDPGIERDRILETACDLARSQQFERALAVLESGLSGETPWPAAYGVQAYCLLQLNRLRQAEAVCLEVLRHNEWSVEAYLILGLASRQAGDTASAQAAFQKAVYLDPACWLAHYHLAEGFAALKHTEEAQREYAVTLRLLNKKGLDHHGLPFLPLQDTLDQMIRLCHSRLEELETSGTGKDRHGV